MGRILTAIKSIFPKKVTLPLHGQSVLALDRLGILHHPHYLEGDEDVALICKRCGSFACRSGAILKATWDCDKEYVLEEACEHQEGWPTAGAFKSIYWYTGNTTHKSALILDVNSLPSRYAKFTPRRPDDISENGMVVEGSQTHYSLLAWEPQCIGFSHKEACFKLMSASAAYASGAMFPDGTEFSDIERAVCTSLMMFGYEEDERVFVDASQRGAKRTLFRTGPFKFYLDGVHGEDHEGYPADYDLKVTLRITKAGNANIAPVANAGKIFAVLSRTESKKLKKALIETNDAMIKNHLTGAK